MFFTFFFQIVLTFFFQGSDLRNTLFKNLSDSLQIISYCLQITESSAQDHHTASEPVVFPDDHFSRNNTVTRTGDPAESIDHSGSLQLPAKLFHSPVRKDFKQKRFAHTH